LLTQICGFPQKVSQLWNNTGVLLIVPSNGNLMTTTTYEYQVLALEGEAETLQTQLNALGQEGWLLISAQLAEAKRGIKSLLGLARRRIVSAPTSPSPKTIASSGASSAPSRPARGLLGECLRLSREREDGSRFASAEYLAKSLGLDPQELLSELEREGLRATRADERAQSLRVQGWLLRLKYGKDGEKLWFNASQAQARATEPEHGAPEPAFA
jgi:hypothetical protein